MTCIESSRYGTTAASVDDSCRRPTNALPLPDLLSSVRRAHSSSELNRNGIDGLLQREIQIEPQPLLANPPSPAHHRPGSTSRRTYEPDKEIMVVQPYPARTSTSTYGGAYSPVQLGAVLPRAAADRRPAEQEPALRGGAAMVPLHLRPHRHLERPVPQRYWRTKPFHETTREDYQQQRIQNILHAAGQGRRSADGRAQPGRATGTGRLRAAGRRSGASTRSSRT